MLSKSCEYGLRAALYLAFLDETGYVPIGSISDELGISFPFLTKILQKLNDADLLASQRGPHGGVALAASPREISLYDVVVAIDGNEMFEECVLGLPGCGEDEPCPIHDQWTPQRDRLETMLRSASLAELPDMRLSIEA